MATLTFEQEVNEIVARLDEYASDDVIVDVAKRKTLIDAYSANAVKAAEATIKARTAQAEQNNSGEKPATDPLPLLPVQFKKYRNWVTWKDVEHKAPIISGTFDNARTDDSSTWVSYPTALENIRNGKGYANLGFVTDGKGTDYLTALDIDGCRNPENGEIAGWAQRILNALPATYTEVTPSKTGIRPWVKTLLPDNAESVFKLAVSAGYGSKVQIEVYDDRKYFTMTGDKLESAVDTVGCLHEAGVEHLFDLLKTLQDEFPVAAKKEPKVKRAKLVTQQDGSLRFEPIPPDPAFKDLQDCVGWAPLENRLHKMEDSRFQGVELKAGKLLFCPMPQHAPRGKDVHYGSACFGVVQSHPYLVHCFGCGYTGDLVKTVKAFGAGEEGGKVEYQTMYDCARAICSEEQLNFNDFFPEKENDRQVQTTQVPAGRSMKFIRGDSIKPVRLKWLWKNRILADKLNVFSGEPDVGKGMTTVDFSARITRHSDSPDCKNELDGARSVLFLSSEDDIEDTIIPRLQIAGADMSKIHFAEISENSSGTLTEGIVCLDRDLPVLEEMIKKHPDIVLIIPDPVIAFLGDADPNKDKEVRPIYSKMKSFAKRLNVGWLFVNHWNKNQNASSINRTSGAKTMVSAPRATWMFSRSPEDPNRYLMMKGKGNLSAGAKTLAYRIIGEPYDFQDGKPPAEVPRLIWDGETEHTAEDILQEQADPKSRRNNKAEELLTKLLDAGAVLAKDIYLAGDKEHLSPDKMKRARYSLGYVAEQIDNRWFWAKCEDDLVTRKERLYSPGPKLRPDVQF